MLPGELQVPGQPYKGSYQKARAIILPSSVIKNIEIPSVDPIEIKSIIDLQAAVTRPIPWILIGYVNIGVSKIIQSPFDHCQPSSCQGSIHYLPPLASTLSGLRLPRNARRFLWNDLQRTDDNPMGIIDIGRYTADFTIECNTVIASQSPFRMDHL